MLPEYRARGAFRPEKGSFDGCELIMLMRFESDECRALRSFMAPESAPHAAPALHGPNGGSPPRGRQGSGKGPPRRALKKQPINHFRLFPWGKKAQ